MNQLLVSIYNSTNC